MNISLSSSEIQSLRELLSQQLNYLSPSHLLELSSFLGYLKHRDNLSTAKNPSPMTLEGLSRYYAPRSNAVGTLRVQCFSVTIHTR